MAKGKRSGRPSRYKPEYCEQAEKLCLLGATNERLADFFGVTVSTISMWITTHIEFSDALKEGRECADMKVAKSLFQRAIGYEITETHEINKPVKIDDGEFETVTIETKRVTKQVAPDVTAQIFWLKNRRPDLWRDRKELDNQVTIQDNTVENMTEEELLELIANGKKD
ncbi:MAG: hypothetical protein ACRDDZ_01330 [Marinifilaceae bacterium]